MIACLKGTLIATSLDAAVIDVQGVGYQVLMASKSLARLGMPGDTVRVLTHLQIRDDALVLYGFLNQEEKDLFLRLVSVSSVGPKVALAVLSTFDPGDAIAAIVSQDLSAIQRVPGVGKKWLPVSSLNLRSHLLEKGNLVPQKCFSRRSIPRKQFWRLCFLWDLLQKKRVFLLKGLPKKHQRRYYCNMPSSAWESKAA